MNWTLEHNGVEKTVADWGFSHLQRRLVSQGTDELTFVAEGRAADATALFTPFQDMLVLRRDRVQDDAGHWSGGVIWFTGLVIQVPRRGAPGSEANSFRLAGPWWYLDTLVFEKTFNLVTAINNGVRTYATQTFSHCFLNLANTAPQTPLGKMTTGQQIIEALQWALKPFVDAAAPPPFQIGTVSPALDVPFDEVRDLTCAEVIHKMLRWSPDAVTWFDYSDSPPMFHCRRRAELGVINLPLNAGNLIRDLRVNPRYDLQSNYVLIRYEQTSVINGQNFFSAVEDRWPDPLPAAPLQNFNALRFTVDLQGLQATTTTAKLVCDAIDPTNPDWWLARHPQFTPRDPAAADEDNNPITDFTLDLDSIRRSPTNPAQFDLGFVRELTAGQIADWMNFGAQRLTLSCTATLRHRNGHVVRDHPITYQFLATDATTGTYQNQQISVYAEPVPVGLARDIFDAISVLQFDGELALQEAEVSGALSLGHQFNLTGGNLAEWSAMNALIQSVVENLDEGFTTIEFGPPKNLSAGELVDLLRVNRNRLIHYGVNLSLNGESSGAGGNVSLGSSTPEKNSASTPGFIQTHVVSNAIDASGPVLSTVASDDDVVTVWNPDGAAAKNQPAPAGSITINPGAISPTDKSAGIRLSIQKIAVCQNGVSGQMYFLCSSFIPDP